MPKLVRTARGQLVDFELLAIKQQMANQPVPRAVEEREKAIAQKDGVKTEVTPDLDMLAVAKEAAGISAQKGAQLKKK